MKGRWPQSREIRLAADEARSVVLRAGRLLVGVEGDVWVTGDGLGDEILRPGQALSFRREARLVLGGLRSAPARLVIMPSEVERQSLARGLRPSRPRLAVLPGAQAPATAVAAAPRSQPSPALSKGCRPSA